MKNIHVLPTDKPSRLIKSQDNDFVYLNTNAPNWFENNLKTIKQNIYITSDEEIKDGDWCYYENGDLKGIHKVVNGQRPKTMILKKIILTTDKDLIKDGVQAIDDEFLEWFVKNPSCEFVETYLVPKNDFSYKYRIIIPKEEPSTWDKLVKEVGSEEELVKFIKSDPTLSVMMREAMRNNCKKEEPKQETENLKNFKKVVSDEISPAMKDFIKEKQETLEEVAERHSETCKLDRHEINPFINGFLEGAKYQAEKMYSEEEVKNIAYEFHKKFAFTHAIKWDWFFEQFKKK
jgi:hypothetical protein